nr:hypothetical protein [uncultured Ruegeria sp.]
MVIRAAADIPTHSIVMKSADVAEVTIDGKMTRIRNKPIPIGLHLMAENVPEAAKVITQATNGADFHGRCREYIAPARKFITQNGRKEAAKLLKEAKL